MRTIFRPQTTTEQAANNPNRKQTADENIQNYYRPKALETASSSKQSIKMDAFSQMQLWEIFLAWGVLFGASEKTREGLEGELPGLEVAAICFTKKGFNVSLLQNWGR